MSGSSPKSDIRIHAGRDLQNPEAIRRAVDEVFERNQVFHDALANSGRRPLIVIKPNWVQERHDHRADVWEPVITNPDLVLAVAVCVAERLAGKDTTICVCDAPHQYADFAVIVGRGRFGARFAALAQKHPAIRFELLDLRREVSIRKEGVVIERRRQPDDPRGYVKVNLGRDGLFFGHPGEGLYYGADYDSRVVNTHHRGEIQEYLIAGTPMACDLFINLPKMKTHQKTGITCCIKNLVGINGEKNWLPHHTNGFPGTNGDEFPERSRANRLESAARVLGRQLAVALPSSGMWLYRKVRRAGERILGDSQTVIRNGNWAGNDTCWRMALDLNRALLYSNPDCTWRDATRPKPYLTIVDGIVGGEGDGPLSPDPVQSSVLISGTDPAGVDAVAAKLMGFDPRRIPIIRRAFDSHRWPIATQPMDGVKVFDGRVGRQVALGDIVPSIAGGFRPHFGWPDIVERKVSNGISSKTAVL